MPRGRKPKPQALRLAQGIVSHKKRKYEPNVPLVKGLEAPDDLNDAERREWFDLVPRLAELDMLTRLDAKTIRLWCETRVVYARALNRVKRQPYIGNRRSAAWGVLDSSRNTLLRLASEMGMTPSARCKLASANPPKAGDDFDLFVDSA